MKKAIVIEEYLNSKTKQNIGEISDKMKMLDVAFSTVIHKYTLAFVGKENLLSHPIYVKFFEKIKLIDPIALLDFCKFLESVIDEIKPNVINVFFGDYLYDMNSPVRDVVEEFLSTVSCKKILTTFPISIPSEIQGISDIFNILLNSASVNIIENDKFFDNFDLINFQYFGNEKNKLHYMFALANAITFANHEIALTRVARKEEYKDVLKEFAEIKEVLPSVKLNVVPTDIISYYYYKLLSMKYNIYVEPRKRISAFPRNEVYCYTLY